MSRRPVQEDRDLKVKFSDINVNLKLDNPGMVEIVDLLKVLVSKTTTIQQGVNKIMALSEESKAVLQRVDDFSNKIAGSLTKLAEGQTEVSKDIKELLEGATGTEAKELREAITPKLDVLEQSSAAIDTVADALVQLGKDTQAGGVPDVPPDVEPPDVDPNLPGSRGKRR